MTYVATASLAWEGGNAEDGDEVDPATVPTAVWTRFVETGAVKEAGSEPADD